MLVFWNNGFLRQLILLGVWLFGNNENEILALDQTGERHVDLYGSDGSPFARLVPDLHGGELEGPREWHDRATTAGRASEEGHAGRAGDRSDTAEGRDSSTRPASHHLSAPLTLLTLQKVLAYTREGAPLPLAVAAAGPRLRLAGEHVAVFFFPGAAASLRCDAAGDVGGAAPARAPRAATLDSPTLLHGGTSAGVYCRVVRGPSLSGVTAAMQRAAWWYGRPCPSVFAGGAALAPLHLPGSELAEAHGDVEGEGDGEAMRGGEAASLTALLPASSALRGTCLPLCVEVIAPRVVQPFAASSSPAQLRGGARRGAPVGRVLSVAQSLVARVVHRLASGASAAGAATPLDPADAELRAAAAQFVSLIDLLWRRRRCALVELAVERYPVAMTEWMLSPELHASANGGGVAAVHEVQRTRRAFGHVRVLRCRGRVSPAAVVTVAAPNAAAAGGAAASSSFGAGGALASSSAAAVVAAVPGRGLHPASLAAAPGVVLSVSLTAVRSHVRLLDLANTTTLSSLDGIGGCTALEKIVLTRCTQLRSLSPLGAAPALRDVVASQSGIFDITGLAQSRTLVSLSLYGCLHLTDVSACGAIPTLRDMFISESTVEMLDGLRDSRSLARLGMRYCDIPLLAALSPVASLTVLHAASSGLTSVDALQHCAALEVVEVSACAQLADLGPLGLAPSVREIDATGSGVRHVAGLSRSSSLEKLLLSHCVHLDDVGPLRQCRRLRVLHLSGIPVRHLEGLAESPLLEHLDISFCRQLVSYAVLPRLPRLRHVSMAGCTAAQRRAEEVAAVVAALRTGRSDATVVLR